MTDVFHARLRMRWRRHPGSGARAATGHKKSRRSPVGNERCPARGTIPLRRSIMGTAFIRMAFDAMRRLNNGSRLVRLDLPPPPTESASDADRLGAELRGLIRWRSRSRFAATAVLLPNPTRDLSSSSLRSSVVVATVAIGTASVNPRPDAQVPPVTNLAMLRSFYLGRGRVRSTCWSFTLSRRSSYFCCFVRTAFGCGCRSGPAAAPRFTFASGRWPIRRRGIPASGHRGSRRNMDSRRRPGQKDHNRPVSASFSLVIDLERRGSDAA